MSKTNIYRSVDMNSSVILVIIGLITKIESNQQPLCGTLASNYIPCIESVQANQIFSSCCEQFVDRECQHLCRYETRDIVARKEVSIIYFIPTRNRYFN